MPYRKVALLGGLPLGCAFLFFSCRWTPSTEILVHIKSSEPARTRAPAAASDFDCYFINVTGDDVKTTFDRPLTSLESCSTLGTVSTLLDLKSLREGVALTVVAGSKRAVDLWGVTGTTAALCSGGLDSLTRSRGTEIYKVSSTVTDLFLNSTIDLGNDFDKETKHTNCSLGDATEPTLIYTPLLSLNIYLGADSSDVPDSGDWDGNLPPPTSLGNLSGPFPDTSFVGVTHALSEQTIRNDITYTLPSMDLSAYRAIRFRISAEGGTVPFDGFTCDTASPITGNGFRYEFRDGSVNDWTTGNFGANGATAAVFTQSLEPPTPFAVQANDTWRTLFPAFHITVRSRDSGDVSTVCSALRIDSVGADLVTLAR